MNANYTVPALPVILPSTLAQRIVEQVSQSHAGFFQLKLDYGFGLPLILGCNRRWILIAEVSVSNRLSEPVPLHRPILDAPLLPFSSVLRCYPALQFRRERRWIAGDVSE